MARGSRRIPKLRHHKATDRAFVRLDGRDFYLGKWGPESRRRYEVVIAEWLATGRNPLIPHEGLSITELAKAYRRFARTYYLKDGKPTAEVYAIDYALRPLLKLYGSKKVAEFGPVALKAVRETLVERGQSRRFINDVVGRMKRMFKWGAENELVPASVFHALQTVVGLKKGRTLAPETDPIQPVELKEVQAMIDHVAPQVAAMIWVQYWTGMRPGEVVIMRMADLDRSGRVWVYRPDRHKTEHLGRERVIYLGPKAQEVLQPWLRADPQAYLFRPVDAEAERNRRRREKRKTPVQPSQRNRRRKKPKVQPREHYTTDTYRSAIAGGCEKAGIASWAPNQLRHSAATRLRRERGIEAARVVLGHASATVTEIYAEIDRNAARDVMGDLG